MSSTIWWPPLQKNSPFKTIPYMKYPALFPFHFSFPPYECLSARRKIEMKKASERNLISFSSLFNEFPSRQFAPCHAKPCLKSTYIHTHSTNQPRTGCEKVQNECTFCFELWSTLSGRRRSMCAKRGDKNDIIHSKSK